MKTTITVFMLALALLLSGCGGPVANNAPPANTNTARNVPAAPTVDALFTLDKQAQEAYAKGDAAFFQTFLSEKFMMLGMKGERHTKADAVKMIGGVKCDIKSKEFTDPQMAKIDNDTYVVTYRSTWDGTCTENGKSMKVPSPVRSASIFVRSGNDWKGAWHGETAIMEADAAPADAKKADAKADTKKEEPKKDEAKKADSKADATAADTASGESKPASSMAKNDAKKPEDGKPIKEADPLAPMDKTIPVADANTEALTKLHTAGWAAYKDRDAAKLEAMTASSLSFVSPEGKWFGDKASTIKEWTAGKCDIKSTSVTDGFGVALSPTVELFFSKGTANGTCDGPDGKPMKLGSLWGSAIYVKEGNDWKMSFLFESPA